MFSYNLKCGSEVVNCLTVALSMKVLLLHFPNSFSLVFRCMMEANQKLFRRNLSVEFFMHVNA